MDISAIRRANIRFLITDRGLEQHEFASRAGISESYLSLILGSTSSRNCGNVVARRIEQNFGLAAGWLDQRHPIDKETEMYVETFLGLPGPLRKEALRQLHALAELAKLMPSEPTSSERAAESTPSPKTPKDPNG